MKRALLLALLLSSTARADVPDVMTWAGVLTDDTGAPVDGTHAFTFEVFAAATGGTALVAFPANVDVVDGELVVDLAFDPSLFDGSARFMAITVDGDLLDPRVRLSTQAYASRAGAIDWSEIENVPADFADDVDDIGVGGPILAGTGIRIDGGDRVNIADNGIVTSHFTDQCVGTAELQDNSVTSVKIQDATITSSDLADNSVASSEIVNDSIVAADIASDAITTNEIDDGEVTLADLAANSVNGTKIVDGSIVAGDLANDSVTTQKINDGEVALADLASNSVNAAKIVDGSIVAGDLASDAVTNAKIADDAVELAHLQNNSVDGANIVDQSIAAVDLGASSVTNAKIADGAVSNAKLATDAVSAVKVAGNVQVFLVANQACTLAGALTTANTCRAAPCVNGNGELLFRDCSDAACDQTSSGTCSLGANNTNSTTPLGVLVP